MSTNGPWGNGNQGYASWNPSGPAGGQVMFGPSTFSPMTYQQKYGAPQQAQPQANPYDLFSGVQQQAPRQMNVSSGIEARPVYNQQQMNSALSKYSSMAPAHTDGPLGKAAANLYGQQAGRARVAADRNFTQANAQTLLQTENGRAQSGLGWGRLGNQQAALADNQALNQQQMGLALLRQMGIL